MLRVRCNNRVLLAQFKQQMQDYMLDHGRSAPIDAQVDGSDTFKVVLERDGTNAGTLELSQEEILQGGMDGLLERTYQIL